MDMNYIHMMAIHSHYYLPDISPRQKTERSFEHIKKNYHNFDFDNVENNDALVDSVDDNKPMTFTREDYKRFMALSNIDDKK